MERQPRRPSHPGTILQSYLIGQSLTEVAASFGITTYLLEEIYACQSPVTPELAGRIDKELKTSPGLWLRLQKSYDDWEQTITA